MDLAYELIAKWIATLPHGIYGFPKEEFEENLPERDLSLCDNEKEFDRARPARFQSNASLLHHHDL